METLTVNPIGTVTTNEDGSSFIQLEEKYVPALKGLEGFSHLSIIWWFSELDKPEMRNILQMDAPYKVGPDKMGIFATRSPVRPNPLAFSVVEVSSINWDKGVIYIPYFDAHSGTPVLDIKPYTPSEDRIETPTTPNWCAHWPKSKEASATFNWQTEMVW